MYDFIQWFRGGAYYHYHNLIHCMDSDFVTLTIVLILCVGVFTGYLIIAYRWSTAAKSVPESPAKRALNDLKWIFIICAICGYAWVLLEVFWPGWRLYMIMLAWLNLYTWRYIIRENSLEKLYEYLKDRDDLVQKINDQQETIDQLKISKL